MRILAIYNKESDHARATEDFLYEFERRTGYKIETLSPYDRENESLLRAYDIVEYPTIIALSESGELLHIWKGMPIPLINEVSYYLG